MWLEHHLSESCTPYGLYEGAAEFISEAIKTLWVARKDLWLEVAYRLYAQGDIPIGKACEMADVDIERFKDILDSKGITRESASTVEAINDEGLGLEGILGRMVIVASERMLITVASRSKTNSCGQRERNPMS